MPSSSTKYKLLIEDLSRPLTIEDDPLTAVFVSKEYDLPEGETFVGHPEELEFPSTDTISKDDEKICLNDYLQLTPESISKYHGSFIFDGSKVCYLDHSLEGTDVIRAEVLAQVDKITSKLKGVKSFLRRKKKRNKERNRLETRRMRLFGNRERFHNNAAKLNSGDRLYFGFGFQAYRITLIEASD